MNFKRRTHTCGELKTKDVGKTVLLNGWVDSRRDLGGLIFIGLRDRYGITQIVFDSEQNNATHKLGKELRNEFVISIEGIVRQRPADQVAGNMDTGGIDVVVDTLVILNEAETPPFPIKDNVDVFEDLKLKYRYLDLRRPTLQKNLLIRHRMYQTVRNFFDKNSFIEIETPVLMKSTPEGARDYLVPSRLHRGKFYALPQSPQTYKQLLMVSGFDRYFQIVKCFRDEDQRADRQPEFTQIDVEMSFVDSEDVFEVVEGLMKVLFEQIWNKNLRSPVPRFTFDEAMEKYGSDKPDLRFGLELVTLNKVFKSSEFKVFKDPVSTDGIVTGITAPGCATYSRNQIDNLTALVKKLGAKGLIWIKVTEDGLDSPVSKFLSDDEKGKIKKQLNAKTGDLILILAGERLSTLTQMGALRLEIANRLKLVDDNTEPKLLWVTDFPLLEWDEEHHRFHAMHHPFTSPKAADMPRMLDGDHETMKSLRADAYDLVINGVEIGGGSIRIHDRALQEKNFKLLGFTPEEAENQFGFLMGAFEYGAPPHGGIAFGFDRLCAVMMGSTSIRDFIAFPKNNMGRDMMIDAPSEIALSQLDELALSLKKKD